MENNSSLDPLGPEFGKVNAPAINSKSMSAFEGDLLRDNKINFRPVTPPLSSTHPNYEIQDSITGHAPSIPSSKNPRKNVSVKEIKDAIGKSFVMQADATHDKSQYARVNAYNAGPSGNSFYKRYAAYGQKKFDEVGFSPLRNNEAMFNANTTIGDDFTRMMKNSFVPLFTRGFVSGPKSLIKMMQGDFSPDTEDARAYENAAAIGQSSRKGFGAFFNNTAMSFSYTAGIISEAILEEAAGALLSPLTGGGSFFAATANNARKIGKLGSATDLAMDGYKAVNTTLKEANSIDGARRMWQAAENIGKNKAFKFLNPLENTFDAAVGIGKNADNLTGLARLAQGTSKTAGGLFRDIRNINMALAEARLEGGMTQNKIYDSAYDAFYKKNNRAPTNEEQYEITKLAKEAGMNTLMWNTAIIMASNKVVLPNLLKSGVSKSAMKSKIDDVLAMKGGKITFQKGVAEEGKKVAKGTFEFVEDSFKNSLKGFKAAPIKTTAKIAGRYLKANLMEGVQENLQETISYANENYYLNAYKNKELGAHLYNRAQSSLRYEGFTNQFSAQGFETFASGALMGLFSGGLGAVKSGIDFAYNKTLNKEQYNKYKELRKTHGESVAKRLTDLYADPKEFFNSRIFNYGVQNNAVADSEDADTKLAKDIKREAFASQVYTALDTNTINYFKDHIASFKTTTPEEFEEAFGFEQGTGAKEQMRIDSILDNIETMQKSYDYAKNRFPNPVDSSQYEQGTPEYESAALFERAWDNGVKNYVFNNDAFIDTTKRMSSIIGSFIENPSMQNMSQTDVNLIFKPNNIAKEKILLKNEIAGLKESNDPTLKDQIRIKENKLNALEKFSDAYFKRDAYKNRTNANAILEAYKKEQDISELSEAEKEEILNIAFGEKNAENDYKNRAELELAYKDFLKASNDIDGAYIFDTDADKGFEELLDYYNLDAESKQLVTYINLLHSPQGFMEQVEKSQTWMSDMYNNRHQYYTDMVNKYMSGVENNEALNALADMNVFIDLDAFQAYMNDDILPDEFIDETTKQVIPKGTQRYNELLNILFINKTIKAEDAIAPSMDQNLQTKLDTLDDQEQKAIEALPKIESITTVKRVVAKDKPLTLKDIYQDIDDSQYVDAIYEGSDQKITLYLSFEGTLKLNDASGEVVNHETVKDKFSEYTIYKKSMVPDPESVKDIKDKYDNLREEAAENFAQKKAKTKADVYSNYTPVDELPQDLYKELQETFQQTDIAIQADEDDTSDEELMDLFKAFVKNNPLAEDVINNYNNKSKDAAEKEKLGEIDDFDFILNNKKLNTTNYSTTDIKEFKKQFETLRDNTDKTIEKTVYQDIINKFDRLISTREVKSFTPEVQEIIKTIKNELTAKQNKIEKITDLGYKVNGQLLERVTNFIQQFKTDKYKYSGEKIINKAFENTIAAAGLKDTTINSFIKELRKGLHVDSTNKNYGYTDDTENIIKKHLKDILDKGLDKTLYKDKQELLDSIQAVISENAYEASRVAGNYVDEQLRRIFTKGEAPVFDEKKITKEAYDKLFGPTSFIKEIKQKVDSGELYTLATGLKVYDVDANVAGEMDLLLIDKAGKLHIIDFKTGTESKWNGFVDKSDFGLSKLEDYTLQQYTYARLLKKMTGLDADINIFPIETKLDQNNKLITDANDPTNKKLTGTGKWYFSLDPNFSDAKAKIDKAIPIEAPGIKVATSINPVYKKQLKNIGYPDELINTFTKEEAAKYTKIPYSEYVKLNSVSSFEPTIDATDIERRRQEDLQNGELFLMNDGTYGGSRNVSLNFYSDVQIKEGNPEGDIRTWDYKNYDGTGIFVNKKLGIAYIVPNNTFSKTPQVFKVFMDRNTFKFDLNNPRLINRPNIETSAKAYNVSADNYYNEVLNAVTKYDAELAAIEKTTENKSVVEPVLDTTEIEKRRNKAYSNIRFNYSTDSGYYGVYTNAKGEEEVVEGWNQNKVKEKLKEKYDAELSTVGTTDAKADIERKPDESVKDFIERLFSNNYLIEVDGKQIFSLTQGRWGVVVNIDGIQVPFYQSTSGTDTKVKGQWYPFFGDQGNWVIKGNSVDSESGYGFKQINAVQNFLNKNITETDAIALSSIISKEVLQNQSSLRVLDESKIKGNEKISLNKEATAKRLANVAGYSLEEGRKTKSDLELFNLASKKIFTELATLENNVTATKASELNLQKGDTVIVKEPIMDKDKVFADTGSTLTVLKSDEKSVSFTYGNDEKTLTLPEMDKHVTTMGIEEVKQAEKTQEVLDAIDKQTVTETINALTDFIGDKKAIENAINKASSNDVTAEELTNDLLEDLSCK